MLGVCIHRILIWRARCGVHVETPRHHLYACMHVSLLLNKDMHSLCGPRPVQEEDFAIPELSEEEKRKYVNFWQRYKSSECLEPSATSGGDNVPALRRPGALVFSEESSATLLPGNQAAAGAAVPLTAAVPLQNQASAPASAPGAASAAAVPLQNHVGVAPKLLSAPGSPAPAATLAGAVPVPKTLSATLPVPNLATPAFFAAASPATAALLQATAPGRAPAGLLLAGTPVLTPTPTAALAAAPARLAAAPLWAGTLPAPTAPAPTAPAAPASPATPPALRQVSASSTAKGTAPNLVWTGTSATANPATSTTLAGTAVPLQNQASPAAPLAAAPPLLPLDNQASAPTARAPAPTVAATLPAPVVPEATSPATAPAVATAVPAPAVPEATSPATAPAFAGTVPAPAVPEATSPATATAFAATVPAPAVPEATSPATAPDVAATVPPVVPEATSPATATAFAGTVPAPAVPEATSQATAPDVAATVPPVVPEATSPATAPAVSAAVPAPAVPEATSQATAPAVAVASPAHNGRLGLCARCSIVYSEEQIDMGGNLCFSCGTPLQAVLVQTEKQPDRATIASEVAAPTDNLAQSPDKRDSTAMPDSLATQADSLDAATLPDGDTHMEDGQGNGLAEMDVDSSDAAPDAITQPEANADQLALMLQLMTQKLQKMQPDHPALNQHWVSDPSAHLQLAVPPATVPATAPAAPSAATKFFPRGAEPKAGADLQLALLPATAPAAAPKASPATMVSEPGAQELSLPAATADTTAAASATNAPTMPIPAPPHPMMPSAVTAPPSLNMPTPGGELALALTAPAKAAPSCGPPPKAPVQPVTPSQTTQLQRQDSVCNSSTHPTEWAAYRRFCERNEWANELRTVWQPLSQNRQKQHSTHSCAVQSLQHPCRVQFAT